MFVLRKAATVSQRMHMCNQVHTWIDAMATALDVLPTCFTDVYAADLPRFGRCQLYVSLSSVCRDLRIAEAPLFPTLCHGTVAVVQLTMG